MFLDKVEKSFDLESLVTESYENLIEFQENIHELDIKMIKCEHTAIVNEDSEMMMLAEEEYKSKLQATIKAIWNKIVITIQNFIIFLNKMIAKFRNRFTVSKNLKSSIEKAVEVLKNPDNYQTHGGFILKSGQKVDSGLITSLPRYLYMNKEILKNPDEFTREVEKTITELKNLRNGNFDNQKAKEILENMKSFNLGESDNIKRKNYKPGVVNFDTKMIINAFTIITEHGPKWIKSLEIAKNEAKTKLSQTITDSEQTAEATYFQRIINRCILAIQSIITSCFRICSSVMQIGTKDDTVRKEKEAEIKKDEEREELKVKVKNEIEKLEPMLNKAIKEKDNDTIMKIYKKLKAYDEQLGLFGSYKLREMIAKAELNHPDLTVEL